MDHGTILKRAWKLLWDYKALWVFGILFAIFTTSGGSSRSSYDIGQPDWRNNRDGSSSRESREFFEGDFFTSLEDAFAEIETEFEAGIPLEDRGEVITILVITGILILAFALLGLFVRYTSEVAMIKMVDEYEETSEKVSIREGFRLGWSRSAFNVFLIDLIFALPFLLFFACGFGFFIFFIDDFLTGNIGDIFVIVVGLGTFFIGLFIAFLISVVLDLFKHFFHRAAVLEGKGVRDSIRYGYTMVRMSFKDVGIMWLIMLAISAAYSIVMIPLGFIVILIGGVIGGMGGLVTYQAITIADNPLAFLPVILIGVVIFVIVISIPISFVEGLRQVFVSNTWTLSYRELRSSENLSNGVVAIEPPPSAVQTE